ncbi:MAG TPA: molybdopterin oxidoreductase, partial [Chromatiaceae bacterium]|nr:molybdopterin oxidoreductase [Chromatiaceae bacterium]
MADEVLPGVCNMCMQGDCGIIVHVKDGVIIKIEGNPSSPTNQGKVDLRGLSAIMNIYNPYRVKSPLKRTNPEKHPDVDPSWAEIDWDEALDIVAERLRKVRREDPRKLVIWEGWGGYDIFFILMV